MVAVLIALLSSGFWGASDVLGGVAARTSTVLRTTFWVYLGATAAVLLSLLLVDGHWSGPLLTAGLVAGVTNVLGLMAFYAAFASGPMGPMGAIVGATQALVPVVVAVFWRGETLAGMAMAGIAAAVVGGVLIGLAEGRGGGKATLRPIVWAVLAGAFFGATVTALGLAPKDAGLFAPAIELVLGLCILAAIVLVVRASARVDSVLNSIGLTSGTQQSTRRGRIIAPAGGVVLGLANITQILALQAGSLAAVGVVISLYPVTVAILARVFLGEHLEPLHLIGIAAALCGCALLALA